MSISRDYRREPVPGYKDYYVDTEGNVFSCKKHWMYKLSPGLNPDGYRTVVLCYKDADGKRKRVTKRVASLVCLTFLGPRPEGQEVRHKRDIKTDDRLSELDYGTSKQNGEDMVRNGHSTIGMRHGKCKLNDDEHEEVRLRALSGEKQATIAADYGICQSTVSYIMNGKTKPRK